MSWAPGAIFGGCCVLVTIFVNFLPETMGRELPQTLHDLELWYKKEPEHSEDSEDKQIMMKDLSKEDDQEQNNSEH